MFKYEMSRKIAELAMKHHIGYRTLYNEPRKNNKRRIKLWEMYATNEDVVNFVEEAKQLEDVIIAKKMTGEVLHPMGMFVNVDSISITYNA